jgi:hypothetical protein
VAGAARCQTHETALDAALEDGVIAVSGAVFAEKAG